MRHPAELRNHVGFQGVADMTVPWVCSWLVVFDPTRSLAFLRVNTIAPECPARQPVTPKAVGGLGEQPQRIRLFWHPGS
jgi:hypothetical protein